MGETSGPISSSDAGNSGAGSNNNNASNNSKASAIAAAIGANGSERIDQRRGHQSPAGIRLDPGTCCYQVSLSFDIFRFFWSFECRLDWDTIIWEHFVFDSRLRVILYYIQTTLNRSGFRNRLA